MTRVGKLDGVGSQVDQNLSQAPCIRKHSVGYGRVQMPVQGQRLCLCCIAVEPHHLLQHLFQHDLLLLKGQLARFHFGDV